MINSFGNKLTENIFNGISNKRTTKFNQLSKAINRKLDMINAAKMLEDLRVPPSNKLEKLKGDKKEFYSIRINDPFRLIFKWTDGQAHEVEIIDYH